MVATRQVLLLPPATTPSSQDPDDWEPVNPYLSFTASLNTASSVVALMLTDERAFDALAPDGSGIYYSVTESWGTTAPVLNLQASAPTASEADSIADELVDMVATTLADQQRIADAPRETWIQSSLVAESSGPTHDWTTATMPAVLIFTGVTALMGVALALVARVRVRRMAKGDRLTEYMDRPEHGGSGSPPNAESSGSAASDTSRV